jgi:putative RNA 2'-phosphotransferase
MTNTELSKKMSFLLRHKPESAGLTLTPSGWIELPIFASALQVSESEILAVVEADSKQRFTVRGGSIRAAQGHSFPVELEFEAAEAPATLWHGTVEKFLPTILVEGLKPMSRQFVHLSPTVEVAETVGARRKGETILLKLETAPFLAEGHELFKAENGVWLTKAVPAEFLTRQ